MNILALAQDLFEHCMGVARAALGYPALEKGLLAVPEPVSSEHGEGGEDES